LFDSLLVCRLVPRLVSTENFCYHMQSLALRSACHSQPFVINARAHSRPLHPSPFSSPILVGALSLSQAMWYLCILQSRPLHPHLLLSCPTILSSLVAPLALISSSLIFFSKPILFATKAPLCSSSCAIFSAVVASSRFLATLGVVSIEHEDMGGRYQRTCFISLCVFKPAPYQAPIAVTAAMAPVQTNLRIFCCCADIVTSSPLVPVRYRISEPSTQEQRIVDYAVERIAQLRRSQCRRVIRSEKLSKFMTREILAGWQALTRQFCNANFKYLSNSFSSLITFQTLNIFLN